MKLHEAIEALTADHWFRPVSWRGSGVAYAVKEGHSFFVPSSRGGIEGMTGDLNDLAGEWELTTPDDVLGERK
jgi:hypothetical protein